MKFFHLSVIALLFSICLHAQKESLSGNEPKIYTFVEHNPEFPGGDSALVRFLQQNIVYPVIERDHNIQGKVYLRFVITEDGSVTDVLVARKVSAGLDNEAVRVAKMLPKFIPGTQEGNAVKVYYNLPIKFTLQEATLQDMKSRDPREARVIQKFTNDEDFKKASLMMKDNDYETAINFLEESIKYFPKDYLGYEAKGDCEIKTGRLYDACRDYWKAKELGSPSADLYLTKNCKAQIDSSNLNGEREIFAFVENNPEYPGGEGAMIKFYQENIHYPEMERDKGIEGKVMIWFLVDEDGSVSNVTVVGSVSPGLDKEAIRVIKMLPKFKPGTQGGKTVKVSYTVPVKFNLSDEKYLRDTEFRFAIINMRNGEFERALHNLNNSIKTFPKEYLGYEKKADCEVRIGKIEQACVDYRKAKELGSSNAHLYLEKYCGEPIDSSISQDEAKKISIGEVKPEFPGGEGEMIKFLQQNIVYPKEERDNDIQGKVLMRLIVSEDGTIENITVVKPVSPGLDAEARRVTNLFPKFKPGTIDGKPVKVYYNFPIKFTLN